MSSVLADFTGRFSVSSGEREDAVDGRVLLGEDRLVLACGHDRHTVPIGTVFDVRVGGVSGSKVRLPDPTVTVAYKEDDGATTVLVGSEDQSMTDFATELSKVVLDGTRVSVRHPARIDGNAGDASFRDGVLTMERDDVWIDVADGSVHVPLDAVVGLDRVTREVDGDELPAVAVGHVEDGHVLTTDVATASSRALGIAGRHLRRKYRELFSSLSDLDLSEPEVGLLRTVASAGGDATLDEVVGNHPQRGRRLLKVLGRKGLVESGETGPVLTARGHVALSRYLERDRS